MIQFERMIIRNFLPYRKAIVPLTDLGLVRIEAPNMFGKSSILDALCWVLYGKTLRGVSHDQIINRKASRDCSVSLRFSSNSLSYRATRYRKHTVHKNHLRLTCNGKKISRRHDAETQKRLEQILQCDLIGFRASVAFGGDKPFASLSDSEQKRILESFLHFQVVDQALRRTKKELASIREELRSRQLEIEKQRGVVNGIKEKYTTLKDGQRMFQHSEQKRKQATRREISSCDSRILQAKEVELGLTKSIRFERTYLCNLDRQSNNRGSEEAILRDLYKNLQRSKNAQERLTGIGTVCSSCGQLVSRKSRKTYLKHLRKDQHAAEDAIKTQQSLVKKLERRVAGARAEVDRVQEQKQQYLKSSMNQKGLEERKRTLLLDLNSLRSSSKIFEAKIQKAQDEYSKQVGKLLKLKTEEAALQQKKKDLEFWVEGFGNKGIKALIIRDALPALNEKLEEYAGKIFDQPVNLKFLPAKVKKSGEESELFHVEYSSKYGANNYSGESSGGRRRIDFCILLVMQWLARTCNLLFVDELLDGLDESGRDRVLEILTSLRSTVFCITHNRGLKSQLGKVWRVIKSNGESKLLTS
jgi:DNA repair exonuclease SbcCD ATPase subunit